MNKYNIYSKSELFKYIEDKFWIFIRNAELLSSCDTFMIIRDEVWTVYQDQHKNYIADLKLKTY